MLRALLIANSLYQDRMNLEDLRCPISDATRLRELLTSAKHGEYDAPPSLENEKYKPIVEGLQRLLKSAKKGDTVLIYYSGHGVLDDQNYLYLAAQDTDIGHLETSSIPITTLAWMAGVSNSTDIVVILDCCFSGVASDHLTRQIGKMGEGGPFSYILAASAHAQRAYESPTERFSYLTKHIIGGIETGSADKGDDGWVDVEELFTYARDEMAREGELPQTPHLRNLRTSGTPLRIAKSGVPQGSRQRGKILRKAEDHRTPRRLLPDFVYSEILKLSHLDVQAMSKSQQEYFRLLVEWSDDRVEFGDFLDRWDQIEEVPSRVAGDSASAPPG
jgi:S-DNA-T family DNA segregation ATPase FtsK/SpoIIIE